jgi:hypothetical protein
MKNDFLLKMAIYKCVAIDRGSHLTSAANLQTNIRDGVFGVLYHPNEITNRTVYIHSTVPSQNQLLAIAKQAFGTPTWMT